MDNSFSLYRVGLLIKRQWASFGKIFLIALGAVTLVILGVYLFNLPTKETIGAFRVYKNNLIMLRFPLFVFSIVGILFTTLTSSWYFSKWGKKANAIEELLLPASSLEKYVCSILLTSIVCIVSFSIVFWLIDSGYRMYLNEFFKTLKGKVALNENNDGSVFYKDLRAVSFVDFIGYRYILTIFMGLFCIQSAFLLGSIFFKRFQYIKTLIISLAVIFLGAFVFIKWMMHLVKGKVEVFHTLQELENQHASYIPAFWYFLAGVTIVICYWATYLRIKEKEV